MAGIRASKDLFNEWEKPENLLRLQGWAIDGLIDAQIAENIGIGESTLAHWKARSKAIKEALKKGKDAADREVENALHKAAVEGNPTCMIFWLKNRKPEKWRDGKSLELAGQVNTAPQDFRIVIGGEDESQITNAYYLARKRVIDEHEDEWFRRWKDNNLEAYEAKVAECQAEIDARQETEGGAAV